MKPDWDHPAISKSDGPSANGDPMGTPAADEHVLWKGRPNLPVLTRTAFHMRTYALYFAVLVIAAFALGNMASAVFLIVAGLIGGLIIQAMAWQSARTTLYILTDQRLIFRIGMAVEARINIPLKHINAANLNPRSASGHGDIAVQLSGDRVLGYLLMWPHARPFRFARPEPMLRAVPDAEHVAGLLAEACAAFQPIERNLTQIKEAGSQQGKPEFEGAPA
ncbi:MAG: photosynthetic complex putative assembly protein PuhB [Pseudomonadota bacterium]